MRTRSASGKQAKPAEPVAAIVSQQQEAGAMVSAKDLRDALAEAHENMRMIEQALTPAKPPYGAFFRACAKGDVTAVQTYLAAGLDPNYGDSTALHIAAANGDQALVRVLLDQGAEVDPRLVVAKLSIDNGLAPALQGATPFLLAKANRNESVAAYLRSRGADPDAATAAGDSAQTIRQTLLRIQPGFGTLTITVE